MQGSIRSVFFDIDGTLDDSNDFHAQSWVDAFAESGRAFPFAQIRPLIGMGSDKLLAALGAGVRAGSDEGKALTARRKAIFLDRYLEKVVAFPGARELVLVFKRAHLQCVVASSASPEELTPLLEIAGVAQMFDHAILPDEIAATKPDPDVVLAALAWSRTEPENALMIGDTPYDVGLSSRRRALHRAPLRRFAKRRAGSSGRDIRHAVGAGDGLTGKHDRFVALRLKRAGPARRTEQHPRGRTYVRAAKRDLVAT